MPCSASAQVGGARAHMHRYGRNISRSNFRPLANNNKTKGHYRDWKCCARPRSGALRPLPSARQPNRIGVRRTLNGNAKNRFNRAGERAAPQTHTHTPTHVRSLHHFAPTIIESAIRKRYKTPITWTHQWKSNLIFGYIACRIMPGMLRSEQRRTRGVIYIYCFRCVRSVERCIACYLNYDKLLARLLRNYRCYGIAIPSWASVCSVRLWVFAICWVCLNETLRKQQFGLIFQIRDICRIDLAGCASLHSVNRPIVPMHFQLPDVASRQKGG